MTQAHLPTMEPDWPTVGDVVVLRDGTPAVIGSAQLAEPLNGDRLTDLCIQWGAEWKFCEPEDLDREGDHWRER